MVKARKTRGATRKPVRKQRQPVVWQQWLRMLFVISAFSGLVVAGIWLQQEDTLPILHVTVDGKFMHTDRDKLVTAVTPYVTGNFVNVNVAKLREAGEALPWVRLIQVKRNWPDSLHLVVEEQQAIAQWGSHALVNSNGELFFPAKKTFPAGLTKLHGPKGTSALMTQHLADAVIALKPIGLKVNELKMDNRRSWIIKFNNGMNLMIGRAESKQRLERFISIYEAGLQRYQQQIKTVDMRYTNGVSVVWKSGRLPDFNGTV